ncbi:MAG: UvrD-helicase domain-containing protein [Chloroflexi bacterium]|nr:UvrD-helicase domain-containing protein [Chloroflexota bacterium]
MDFLDKLNPQQRQAVSAGDGPVLVVAGPGSGKTRVLTQRIAYLIASEGVRPWQILAVTFTNKAARSMDERVKSMLNEQATEGMMLGTFHSICARILRREAEHLPIESNFVIFDSDDQERIVKGVIREFNLNEKLYRAASVHAAISRAKNELIGADDYPTNTYRDEVVKRVFAEYQKRLVSSNAVDFDDLLVYTARLLEDNPIVREKYAQRFRHVLVDEFQDTNLAQYALVKHLASHHRNIFCVGDPDQCFPAGTLIRTPYGNKKIENLRTGDFVLAASGRGSTLVARVNHVGARHFKGDLIKVVTKHYHSFLVTPNHIVFANCLNDGQYPKLNWDTDKRRQTQINSFKSAESGLKPPSQYVEALRTGARESDLSDLHVLRQDFSPAASDDTKSGSYFFATGAFLTNNSALEFGLMPASHLRPSMVVAIEKNGQIIEDEIVEVSREPYDGTVYDFEADNLHNYIAGGIVVHNSIYRWRGADWRNVQRFERDFPEAQIILLEQNYRSHQNILNAAMGVIDRAHNRRKKRLFSDRGEGEKIFFYEAPDDYAEAAFTVDTIAQLVASNKFEPGECAVMYRTNAQSRLIEEAFLQARLPYRLVGAQRFYGRREVKDVICFLRLIHNPVDEASLDRVINVPPRGIGDKTLTTLRMVARQNNVSPGTVLMDLARGAESPYWNSFTGRAAIPLADFGGTLANWRALAPMLTVPELFTHILADINYKEYIDDDSEEGTDRWDNVQELKRLAEEYVTRTLEEFLENVALVADQDTIKDNVNAPTLLTLHAAKGLEFGAVFLVGLDDGILPHSRSFDEPESMEEERRLMYVGITRAKDRLYLIRAIQRGGRGMAEETYPSRFLEDIPTDLLAGNTRTGRTLKHSPTETKWPLPPGPRTASVTPVKGVIESKYRAGTRVKHPSWGEGIVLDSKLQDNDEIVDVVFESVGIKRLATSLANLKII